MSITSNQNIKHLKPNKNSRYQQGSINPKSCKKYFNSCRNEPIIYRSGLEYKFMELFENSNKISKWASEPIKIPYYSRLDKKMMNYYPDYIIEMSNGKKIIVEIKPANQTVKPKSEDSLWLKQSWVKNIDKWMAAKKFASEHNMGFTILTEKDLNKIMNI